MASKRSKRPVYRLPPAAAVTLRPDDLEEAAADLYGFRVRETWQRLRAMRESLKAANRPTDRAKLAVIKELTHDADIALHLPAAFSLGDERWALAVEAGIAALDTFRDAWVKAAQIRIDELHIDGNHASANLRESLHIAANHIQKLIDRWAQLHIDLQLLHREPPKRGIKLARWQAMLHKAGFTWSEVADLFEYAHKRDGTPEAARKRVAALLRNSEEVERQKYWFGRLMEEEADI